MSKRNRHKGNRYDEPFVGFTRSLLEAPAFVGLSAYAVKLLVDLASQYRGNNNGDLTAAWKIMRGRGWRSEATLNKAKRELLGAGFIFETRKGHRPNVCSLYALTWFFLDVSDKFDSGKAGGFRRREFLNCAASPCMRKDDVATTRRVAVATL